MDDLDKMIRDAGIEQVSDGFTSGVMEEITSMPLPQASRPLLIPLWFKILMSAVFAGALLLAVFSIKTTQGAASILPDEFYRGMAYLSGLFNTFITWIRAYTWLIPSVLFSLAGMLYLLSRDQDLYHQYG